MYVYIYIYIYIYIRGLMIGVWLRRWIINERVETHYFRRALVITEIINGVEVLA